MPRQEKSPKKKSKKSEEEDPAMDPAAINELVKNAIDQANAEADAVRAEQKLEERLKEAEDRLTKKLDDEVLEIQRAFEESRGAKPTTKMTMLINDYYCDRDPPSPSQASHPAVTLRGPGS